MADHPRHPDTDDQLGVAGDREDTTSRPWGTYALMLIVIVVVLGFVLLHVTGVVGPAAH